MTVRQIILLAGAIGLAGAASAQGVEAKCAALLQAIAQTINDPKDYRKVVNLAPHFNKRLQKCVGTMDYVTKSLSELEPVMRAALAGQFVEKEYLGSHVVVLDPDKELGHFVPSYPNHPPQSCRYQISASDKSTPCTSREEFDRFSKRIMSE